MLEMKQGVGTGDRTMMSKNTNVPCRFSCTQGAVKTWESGDDGLGSGKSLGALATVLSKGSSSKQFLVRKDKGTNVAGLSHMVGRNALLLQGRSCPYKHTRHSQGGVPVAPSPDSGGGLQKLGEGRADM